MFSHFLKQKMASPQSDELYEPASQSDGSDEPAVVDETDNLLRNFKREIKEIIHQDSKALDVAQTKIQKELYDSLNTGSTPHYLYNCYLDRKLAAAGHDVNTSLSRVADMRYPAEWYTRARATQRDVHLHIGPTNSGKTYNALKRLEAASSGFYAGPLRLLAHEVYSRFKAKGLPCDLITGDDVRMDEAEEVKRYSSTVEMVSVRYPVEVAVIDEIQMLADESRGWAWTRAFLGTTAKEVHLCGETRVLPLIQELTASMGDNLKVHEYQRLNPLICERRSLGGDLSKLQKGDALVCFSIIEIHAMKKSIERMTGKRVAIVYGSLPPETRASQAALFNDPDNEYDFLVASDAIGMGLNLSIKRVVFSTAWKFDGMRQRQLTVPQIKQIAGRAGRYRTVRDVKAGDEEAKLDARNPREQKSVGLVTAMDEASLVIIRAALNAEAPPITAAGILPPGEFVEDLAARLPADTPHEYVLTRLAEASAVHPRFQMCSLKDQVRIASIIEPIRGLTTTERHIFCAAPFGFRGDMQAQGARLMAKLAEHVANKDEVTVADIKEIPLEYLEQPLRNYRQYLSQLEYLHQALILFMWLSYRLASVFKEQDMGFHAKEMVERKISTYLDAYSSTGKRVGRSPIRKIEGHFIHKIRTGSSKSDDVPGSTDENHILDDLTMEEGGIRREFQSDASSSDVTVSVESELEDRSALPIDWSQRSQHHSVDEALSEEVPRSDEDAVQKS